jgi:hypothetical protein
MSGDAPFKTCNLHSNTNYKLLLFLHDRGLNPNNNTPGTHSATHH